MSRKISQGFTGTPVDAELVEMECCHHAVLSYPGTVAGDRSDSQTPHLRPGFDVLWLIKNGD